MRSLLVLFISTSVLLLFNSCSKKQKYTIADDTRETVRVGLTEISEQGIKGHTSLSGKIQADNFANVSARIMGYVTNLKVEVGDRVSKGQLLATIQSEEIQAKMAQAEAGISEANAVLSNIEKDYSRIETLFSKKSATQKELDDITAAKNMTLAKLKQAEEMKNEVKTMLSYANIKSPFSGIVTEKMINSGEMATPGRPLFIIETSNDFQAEVMVPESEIAAIKKGEEVKVILKNTDQEINGKIGEFSSSSLHTGGQYLAKIDLDKSDIKGLKLYSGMYVKVLLEQKTSEGLSEKILVNKSAIVTQGQLTGIYTVSDGGTALLRWVRLGKNYGDQVEVLSGISLGEKYISSQEGRLMNGVKVEII